MTKEKEKRQRISETLAESFLKRFLTETAESSGSLHLEVRRLSHRWLGLSEYVREGIDLYLFEQDELFFALEGIVARHRREEVNDALIRTVAPVLAYLALETTAIISEMEKLEREMGLGGALETVAATGRGYNLIWDERASKSKVMEEEGLKVFAEVFFHQLLLSWDLGLVDGAEGEAEVRREEEAAGKRVVFFGESGNKGKKKEEAGGNEFPSLLDEFYAWIWEVRDELVFAVLAAASFLSSPESQRLRVYAIK